MFKYLSVAICVALAAQGIANADSGRAAPPPIVLHCTWSLTTLDKSSTSRWDMNFTVDLVHKTVNGMGASITDTEIEVDNIPTPGGASFFTIDRVTGHMQYGRLGANEHAGLGEGQCIATHRAF
jgi:hypothetical protein